MYSISLNKRDLPLIIKIQEYFGGIGNISHYTKNNAVQFIVADLKSINERIIPQFDTYVFCGNKLTNYLICYPPGGYRPQRDHILKEYRRISKLSSGIPEGSYSERI